MVPGSWETSKTMEGKAIDCLTYQKDEGGLLSISWVLWGQGCRTYQKEDGE